MPIETDQASRPIPRPARGDNVRLIRQLFSDPPVALDEIHADYGPTFTLSAMLRRRTRRRCRWRAGLGLVGAVIPHRRGESACDAAFLDVAGLDGVIRM